MLYDKKIRAYQLAPHHLGHDVIVDVPNQGREGLYLTSVEFRPFGKVIVRGPVTDDGEPYEWEVGLEDEVTVIGSDRPESSGLDDEAAIDAISTLLGTARDWDGAADFLDDIATVLGRTSRPSVGSNPREFRREFLEAMGRPVPASFDQGA